MRDRDRECASNLVDENEMSSWKNQHKTQMNSSFSVKCDIYEQTNRIKSAKTQTRWDTDIAGDFTTFFSFSNKLYVCIKHD